MPYKKSCLTFAIILFISLLDFAYSVTWTNSPPFDYFNGAETLCIDNRIGVLYGGDSQVTSEFSRRYIWSAEVYSSKGGSLEKTYYNSIWTSDTPSLDSAKLKQNHYVVFRLINKISSLENIFKEDTNIEEIDFEWFDYSDVTSFANAFKGMTNLKKINFKSNWKRCDAEKPPKNNRPKPTVMTSMFEGCTSLESVDLSDFDTNLVTDMSSLLNGCKALRALDISYFHFSTDTVAKNMLGGVQGLLYIGIYNISGYIDNIKTTLYNSRDKYIGDLYVCQDTNLISRPPEDTVTTIINMCCDNEYNEGIKCKPS